MEPLAARPLHVAILSTSFPRWEGDAVGSFVFDLGRALVEAGVRVTVIAPYAAGARRRETLGGVEIRRFQYWPPWARQRLVYADGISTNLRRSNRAAAEVPALFAGFALAAAGVPGIDLYHGQFLPTGLPAGAVALLKRKPMVLTALGTDVNGKVGGALGARVTNWTTGRADTVISLSEDLKERVAPHSRRAVVIPLGIDTNRFRPDPAARVPGRIVCVGRLVEVKGQRFGIEAMPAILQRAPHAELVIAGGGALEEELRSCARAAGVADRVRFLGDVSRETIAPLLQSAEVFIQPSLSEGFSVSLLEAMAAGLPCVASNVPAFGDRLVDGETGFLTPIGGVEELAVRVGQLLDDPPLRAAIGARARAVAVERYGWADVARRTIEVYRAAIGRTK